MRFFITLFHDGVKAEDKGPTRLIDTDSLSADSLKFAGNRAYFCSSCGYIWAKWVQDQIDFVGYNWYSYSRTCPNHEWGAWTGDTPGSMLLHGLDIVVLPRSMLEYELMNLTEKS